MNLLTKRFQRVKQRNEQLNGDITGSWCLRDATTNENGATIIIETYNFAPDGIVYWTYNETNAPQEKEQRRWKRINNEAILISGDRGSEYVRYWVRNEQLIMLFDDSMQLFDASKL